MKCRFHFQSGWNLAIDTGLNAKFPRVTEIGKRSCMVHSERGELKVGNYNIEKGM